MRGYYEIETAIPASHRLDIRLPDSIPSGRARVAVIYDLPDTERAAAMGSFLATLPDDVPDGLTREEIQRHLDRERQSWEGEHD